MGKGRLENYDDDALLCIAAAPSVNTLVAQQRGRSMGEPVLGQWQRLLQALQKFLNGRPAPKKALRVLPPCSHIVFIKQHTKISSSLWLEISGAFCCCCCCSSCSCCCCCCCSKLLSLLLLNECAWFVVAAAAVGAVFQLPLSPSLWQRRLSLGVSSHLFAFDTIIYVYRALNARYYQHNNRN